MLAWLKEKGSVIGGVAGALAAFVAALQLFVVTPMNQRFDALERHVNQRFDAQDKYIDQRFDAVDQRFDAQDKRLDALERHVNQRFDAQDTYINQRFDAVNERLDRLADEVSALRDLTAGISERVSRNEGEIDVIRQQLQSADNP